MPDKVLVDNLDDQTVLLILSHLTQELRKDIPEEATAIRSEEDARQAIADFLNVSGENAGQLDVAEIIPDDANSEALGRGMLSLIP